MTLFAATPEQPYHLSVGAVVVTPERKIVYHYYKKLGKWSDVSILMRETIKDGEPLENAVNRGLREEFGAKGEITHFLGSLSAEDVWFIDEDTSVTVQKTTVYFLVQLTEWDTSKRDMIDPEAHSQLREATPEDLIDIFSQQAKQIEWNDLHEAPIIQRAMQYLP